MSDDNSDRFSLSRRKALAGLGGIGTATALGGLGTYAQFSDTEESSFTFTAGGVDGTISFSASYNGDDVSGGTEVLVPDGSEPMVSENNAGLGLNFNDVKPGDYGSILFEVEVENNPAWIASCVYLESSTDGLIYEPEAEVDDDVGDASIGETANADGEGELAENTLIIPFYDSDSTSQFFDSSGVSDSALDDYSDAATAEAFWSNAEGDYNQTGDGYDNLDSDYTVSIPNGDGPDGVLAPRTIADISSSPGSVHTRQWNGDSGISEITAPDGADVGNGCVMLDGDLNAGDDSSDNTRYVNPLQPGDTLYFGYDWHIPFEVGNAAQGDEMEVHLPFKFLQTRHTSVPDFGTYSPGDNTPS